MLKVLLKKQFSELFSLIAFRGVEKTNKRKVGMTILVGVLLAYAIGATGYVMWMMADTLCQGMLAMDKAWVYFAFMGTMAFGTGLIGSVFMTKSILYEAKDNDLLLSMPIPPKTILFVRLVVLYVMTCVFTSLVFIPAVIRYFTLAEFAILPLIFCILITFLLPLAALAVSSLLGFVVAAISARIPWKNAVTIVLIFAFLFGYIILYANMNEVLTLIMSNSEVLSQGFENPLLFVFAQMGLGASGDILGMLAFSAISIGVFAATYYLLAVTFLRIATMKKARAKAKYVEKQRKSRSAIFALAIKELQRYVKNPMILFNSGIGSIIALFLAGYALFDMELCKTIANAPIPKGEVAMILTVIVCFIAASNSITGSCISLEGENLWLLRSMPVSSMQIFTAKTAFHTAYTLVAVLPVTVLVCALLQIPALTVVFALILLIAITLLCAVLGLVINIKFPNLHWKNEMVVVKQSLAGILSMFFSWGVALLALGGHFWFGKYLYAEVYLALVSCVFFAVTAALWGWVYKRGTLLFESL